MNAHYLPFLGVHRSGHSAIHPMAPGPTHPAAFSRILHFVHAISVCLSKYATFSGRASRPEFWWFALFQILIFLAAIMSGDVIAGLVSLGLLLPAMAVGTGRLHDIARSGWWQLIMLTVIGLLVLIYWWAQPSVEAGNTYEVATT